MEFRDFHAKQIEVALDYEKRFEDRLKKRGRSAEDGFADDFTFTVRSEGNVFYVAIPRSVGMNTFFLHANSCPDAKTQRDKFDRSFAIKRLAKRIVESSSDVREALDKYGGFWWEYLSAISLDDKEISGIGFHDMEYRVGYFEARVPGVAASIRRIGLNPFHQVKLSSFLFDQAIREGTLKRDLAFSRHSAIFSALLRAIADHRGACAHPWEKECIVCGRLAMPDTFRAAGEGLHPDTCYWCVQLIARTEKAPSFFRGIDKQIQREVFQSAFAKLDELTDFHYWRTPFVSHKLLRSLRIGFLPREAAAEMSVLLACMPKKEVVGRLYENKEAIILGAGLTNRFPKGKGRGVRTIASDGHLCLSYGERDICEFLAEHSVPHTREPLYAELVAERTAFGASRGDFLIGRTVFEFAGLSGDSAYDAKMERKMKLAAKYGLDVRVISPSDLKRLSEVFQDFL